MARKAFLKIKAGLMDALAYARRRVKYAYVITTKVAGEVENIHAAPVLGLHSNYTKAAKQFDAVLGDRKNQPDFKLYWNMHNIVHMGNHVQMRKAYMEYRSSSTRMVKEEVTVERWQL